MTIELPRNVRLTLDDGTEVPCSVITEPWPDAEGLTIFRAVPDPIPPGRAVVAMSADTLPARSVLTLDVGIAG